MTNQKLFENLRDANFTLSLELKSLSGKCACNASWASLQEDKETWKDIELEIDAIVAKHNKKVKEFMLAPHD